MLPRAFVIMPFGTKPLAQKSWLNQKVSSVESPPATDTIDFNEIYKRLLAPALQQAGYEVVRADSDVGAGDIRTDMFFELVTADLVVADVSILNPNVFYELGVRHGVCPRGVLLVHAKGTEPAPFDISPDRSFAYEATWFIDSASAHPDEETKPSDRHLTREQKSSVSHAREQLAKMFKDALAVDHETIGSPVYSHLPGLKPVNWEDIETSRAKYFIALQGDWLNCVRTAQADGRPGDILTLAVNAPTRLHESRILYEAALALINLCRYSAAERVLIDVIRLDPSHAQAQVQLALVLSHLGKTTLAEHQLRTILEQHKNDPQAADLLGQVFRYLWHLSWMNEHDAIKRRTKAKDASPLAISAIHSFMRAHRSDPKTYFAGFNALMLTFVLKEVGVSRPEETADDFATITTIVRYTARCERHKAIEDGNFVEQFWCTTTLAGIDFMQENYNEALAQIQEACAIPAASSFQLQSFQERLLLLKELEVKVEFVEKALTVVDKAIVARDKHCSCERVFLWSGYAIDGSRDKAIDGSRDKKVVRVSADRLESLATEIEDALKTWHLSKNDLAICTAMTESDIIFAEVCLKLGGCVRILSRNPVASEAEEPLWPFRSSEWQQRFHNLVLPGERKEIWIDNEHLGALIEGSGPQDPICLSNRRQKQWLINTAEMEAEASQATGMDGVKGPKLYGLFLLDTDSADDADDLYDSQDPDNPSFLIRRVNAFKNYQGNVRIFPLRRHSSVLESVVLAAASEKASGARLTLSNSGNA